VDIVFKYFLEKDESGRIKTDEFGKARFLWRKMFIACITGLLLLVSLFKTFQIVPAGHTGVVIYLGKVSDNVLQEGLQIVPPYISRVYKMDNRVLRVDVDATAASKDLQTVTSTVSLNYRVDKSSSASLYKNIGAAYENIVIRSAIQECIKAVTAQYTAEELITKRQEVGSQIKVLIEDKINPFGLQAEIFNIINFDFSEEFNRAIEAKQTAQQAALKAEQDLARIRVEAEQKVAEAKAEAEAYRLKSLEITEEMIKLEAIKKWDGKLPVYISGDSGNIFSIPMN
jgi:regulator of protease activity HflC (stomatin/prohibitin superfamily)